MSRRILALDQSSRTSGYAIFVEGRLETFGHFTIKDEDIGIRLLKIRQQVETLVNKYNITEVIMEDIQLQTNVSNNVSTFKALAEVFGVIYELLTEMDIKVTSALASSWKSKLKIKSRQRQQQKQEAQGLCRCRRTDLGPPSARSSIRHRGGFRTSSDRARRRHRRNW